jgi:NAD-dependent deacetylase
MMNDVAAARNRGPRRTRKVPAVDADIRQQLSEIRRVLTRETPVAVLSGAGISAASGIPTFRGAQDSLWSQYRPQDLATPEAFRHDPELVWRWYDWRRGLIADAAPNAAHEAVVRLARHCRLTVITQNVDGYHQQAGSADVLEFHGSIWRVRCTGCGRESEDRRVPLPVPPRCDACEELLRPAVVWFGEAIDPEVMRAAAEATAACELFLVVGTAGAVYPAAGLVQAARRAGARVLEFNLERSAVTPLADVFVPGSAADTLPVFVG